LKRMLYIKKVRFFSVNTRDKQSSPEFGPAEVGEVLHELIQKVVF